MNNALKNVLIFLGGAATGGLITGLIVHGVTRKHCDEEIESVIETFSEREKSLEQKEPEQKTEEVNTEENVDKMTNNDISTDEYNKLVNIYNEAKDKPFLIDELEYGNDNHDVDLLLYYSDGVLTYEHEHDPLSKDDIERLVGIDNIASICDAPDDRIYVRCPKNNHDYEIVFTNEDFYEGIDST